MKKNKQVWSLYSYDINTLKKGCYEILSTLYLQLGQNPEPEIVVSMTKIFMNDLSTNYSSFELDEVKFALDKYIRENDGPHFVNVPMWNQALRDYRKTKALKKQTKQIDQYELYKNRVDSFNKVIDKREIKKIGKSEL